MTATSAWLVGVEAIMKDPLLEEAEQEIWALKLQQTWAEARCETEHCGLAEEDIQAMIGVLRLGSPSKLRRLQIAREVYLEKADF